MENRMIKTAGGFQYSVNIRYDVDNPTKIASYIPTDTFVALTDEIMASLEPDATNRSRIVTGPYGTGKSHLIAVLAAILKKSLDPTQYEPLIEKLENAGYDEFTPRFRRFISDKPYITVILNGSGKELEQTFIYGLQRSLSEAGITDIMPRTVFQVVTETLHLWETEYPNTFLEFKDLLSTEFNKSYSDFLGEIKEYEFSSVETFQTIYPRLSSGAEFNLYDTKDIPELYRELAFHLKERGYGGVYIIFDEFNKFLETSLQQKKMVDLKLLQDLAEMCNRSSDDQVHLMLISHQHISQYATGLSEELLDTWRKVEGRFTTVNMRQSSAKTYQLISTVIEKDTELWQLHLDTHRDQFQTILENTQERTIFSELSDNDVERWIIKGCYPLHPSTVFSLPRVSNRLAQNERTLFTFLATKDFNTLGEFLEESNQADFHLLTLDVLFDYFYDSAQKQRNRDSLGHNFLRAKESVSKLGSSPDPMAIKILKCLGVIIGLEEPSFPPTLPNLRYSLVYRNSEGAEFDRCFGKLVEDKVIYERKSDGRIQFLTSSDIDFRAAIDGVRGDYRYVNRFQTCGILNEFFAPYPVIANRYNDEYEMTRFFYQEFFSADDIIRGIDWDEYLLNKNYADGVVAYVITEDEEKLGAVYDSLKTTDHSQVIFVCPTSPIGISNLTYDFLALDILKRDKTFLEKDPHCLVELNAYLNDYEEEIEIELSRLMRHQDGTTLIFYDGREQVAVYSGTSLSQFVSGVCEQVFKLTPRINNELINRTNVSRTIVNARKKVVDAILKDVIEVDLGLRGYGPDVSIFRSLLKRTGVYRESDGKVEFSIDERTNEDFYQVIECIQAKLGSGDPVSFADLFDRLRKPPFGLRLGVLPVVLAIAIRNHERELIIRDQSGIEQPLNADLIELITRDPQMYSLQSMTIDTIKKIYLEQIGKIFKEFLPADDGVVNQAYPIAAAMKKWFINLPKYTRETRMHMGAAKRIRRVLNSPINDSNVLLFSEIPWALSEDKEFQPDQVKVYVETIRQVKFELEVHLMFVYTQLEETCKQLLGGVVSKEPLSRVMSDWYRNLSPMTRTHAFSGNAFNLLNLAGQTEIGNDEVLLDEIIKMIVGLSLGDWSDETHHTFLADLEEAIASIEGIDDIENASSIHHKVVFLDNNGKPNERTYTKVQIGPLGRVLYSSLESTLDGFADAINMEEKRQVLLELLRKIS